MPGVPDVAQIRSLKLRHAPWEAAPAWGGRISGLVEMMVRPDVIQYVLRGANQL